MDTRLKERLVGAVALVLIVVLVVPELLTGPRKPPAPAAAEGPAQIRTVVVDLTQSESGPVTRPAAEAAPVLAPAPAAAAPEGTSPPAGDAAVTAPPALAAAPPVRTPAAAEPARGEIARNDAPKADAPKPDAAKPSAAKPPATKAPAEPAKAPPVEAAKPAPAEVAKPAPAEAQKAARPAKAPVAAGEGWVVQLGSFASRDNGEKLAKTLRGKGYRAFVSEFRGSGRILYRVRVGPEQDRSRADAIAARLARDGYKGSVAPH